MSCSTAPPPPFSFLSPLCSQGYTFHAVVPHARRCQMSLQSITIIIHFTSLSKNKNNNNNNDSFLVDDHSDAAWRSFCNYWNAGTYVLGLQIMIYIITIMHL